MNPKAEEALDLYIAQRAEEAKEEFVDRWNFDFCYGSKITESPIEKLLLGYLLVAVDGYNKIEFRFPWYAHNLPRFGTVAGAQVAVGAYRADFFFRCCSEGDYRDLVVECDGHDYHERTKEQARRDKRRDRWMTANHVAVMRFTGSEIYAHPETCAEEIGNRLTHLLEEMLTIQGSGRGAVKKDPLT